MPSHYVNRDLVDRGTRCIGERGKEGGKWEGRGGPVKHASQIAFLARPNSGRGITKLKLGQPYALPLNL